MWHLIGELILEWMINFASRQKFLLHDDGQADEALQDFADFDIELDPEVDDAPFRTKVSDKKVHDMAVSGTLVTRRIKCAIHLEVTDLEAFHELMEEEMWYDEDEGEYQIVRAVNYWICDTTVGPDYADFAGESCEYEVLQVKS